ncbi:MAG: VWA domain-containing protein [Planctomycetes bacterium]|nr:VWA domain-containing protein [Planctomycetota bacterium]
MTSSPPLRVCATALALCAFGLLSPAFAKLDSKEYRKLKKKLTVSIKTDKWVEAGEAMKGLAKDDTKKTFSYLLKLAQKYPMDLAQPFADSVPSFTDPKALEAARKAAGKTKVLQIRRALMFSFAARKDYGPLIDALGDKNEDLVYSAITRLMNDRVDAGVGPMIDLAEKVEKGKSGTWIELRAALADLLGQDCNSAVEFRSLWVALKGQGGLKAAKKLGERTVTGAKKKPAGGHTRERTFFGRAISSSKVVLILDCSGSMVAKDRKRGNSRPSIRRGPKTGGGGGTKAKDPQKAGDPGKVVKPKPAVSRLVRAQRALKKLIDNLDSRVQINIVAYSGVKNVRVWKTNMGIHPLTKANRKSAKKFVDSFFSTGATATDKALEKAYQIKGARAFYLLSDGSPSHGLGQTLAPEEVYKVVRSGDKGRGITIHTMGFVGANRTFMQKLSSMTGGRYSDIPNDD